MNCSSVLFCCVLLLGDFYGERGLRRRRFYDTILHTRLHGVYGMEKSYALLSPAMCIHFTAKRAFKCWTILFYQLSLHAHGTAGSAGHIYIIDGGKGG